MINHLKTQKIINSIDEFHRIWKSIDGGYPYDYQNLESGQTQTLLGALGNDINLGNVLEIGCNTGIYSLVISNFSSHVHAVDINNENIVRARLGMSYALKNGFIRDNITFYRDSVVNMIVNNGSNYNTCIATLVLYYLSDGELLQLMSFIKNSIKTLIIQCRPDRDKMVDGKEDQFGKASYTSLYNGLFKLNDNVDFFRDLGFEGIEIFGMSRACPVIVGRKP
jgi:hypothetical protein